MRKIMFRGKRKDCNVWVYGFYSYLFNEKANDYKHEIVFQHMESADMSYPYPSCHTICAEVLPGTVSQYWRTVNSVDLYDGDIFAINGKYSKIIRYKEDKACFCVANLNQIECEDIFDIWQMPDEKWWNERNILIDVIGNEFDNPELLK